MRAPLGLLVALLIASCGGGLAHKPPAPPLDPAPDLQQSTSGLDVAVIRRTTGGPSLLSLFVDAGSRDTEVPQTAAVAARLAAEAAGRDARGIAHPDAIELTLPCPHAGLHDCVEALRDGLALRTPSAEAVAAAVQAHAAGRRRALSQRAPGAVAVALRALLGTAAQSLLPLGDPVDDEAVTPRAVARFLSDHFGESRALLVVAGPVERAAVRAAAAAAFSGRLRANRKRQARALPTPIANRHVLAEPDARDRVALAATAATPDAAAAVVERWRRELESRGPVTAHVAMLRGGSLALAQLPETLSPWQAVEMLGYLPLQLSPVAGGRAGAVLDDIWSASRMLGLGWATAGGRGDVTAAAAIGVLQSQPPRASSDGTEEAAALTRALRQRLGRNPIAIAARSSDVVEEARVSVVLENGVALEIARESGTGAGIALRFAGGASLDPPTAHGRAAVLAHAAAMHCDGLSRDALHAELRRLGATLQPHVTATAWELRMQLPSETFDAGLALALRCALHPALSPAHLLDATTAVHDQQSADARATRMLAAVARVHAPRSPGQVAPLGSPEGLASLGPVTLHKAAREQRAGRRLAIAIVSPRPADQVLEWLRRRLSGLEPGAPATAPTRSDVVPPGAPPLHGSTSELLFVWRTAAEAGTEAAGLGLAHAIAQAVTAGGVPIRWFGGGRGWSAVAIHAPPQAEASHGPAMQRAARSLTDATLAAEVARQHTALSLARERHVATGGAADRAADMLVERFGLAQRTPEENLATARALRAATPVIVPVR